MSNLETYKNLVGTQEIQKGVVKLTKKSKELGTPVLIIDLDGVQGLIVEDEVDLDVKHKSLVNFVGREVEFIVQEVDEDEKLVICSRKEAQAIRKAELLQRLENGEQFEAKIINHVKFGAYVEIEGISGLLKNNKFAKDFTLIKEVHALGEKILVTLDHVSKNGKLQFKAVNLYENPSIVEIANLEEQTVMHGRIRSIQPWGVFVCIAPGLDALANTPENLEIEEEMEVRFIITQVLPEQGRVRGKIQSVINK